MDKESIQEAKKLYTKPPCPIEIIVRNPISHMEHKKPFTDYEVCCKTNLPYFKKNISTVRRRYNEFSLIRDILISENENILMPSIPRKTYMSNKFDSDIIENRRREFQEFLTIISTHPLILTGPSSKTLIAFLQDP